MNRPAAATAAGRASQRHRENVAARREPELAPAAAVVEREPAPAITPPPAAPRHRGSLGRPAATPVEQSVRRRRQLRQRPGRQPRQRLGRQPRQRVQSRPAPERERAPQPPQPPQPERAHTLRRHSFSFQTGRQLTAGLRPPHLSELHRPHLSELHPGPLLIDRIIRGRLWIPVLGVLLVAIVTMRVEVLRLDVRNTQATALAAQLQSINQQQQARVSELSSTSRIEALATRYGLHMPGPMDVHFVKSESGSGSQLKRAIGSITKPNGGAYSSDVASEQAGNVASEASITGTADTTSAGTTTDQTTSTTSLSAATETTTETETETETGTESTAPVATASGTESTPTEAESTATETDAPAAGDTTAPEAGTTAGDTQSTSADTGSASTAGNTGGTGE